MKSAGRGQSGKTAKAARRKPIRRGNALRADLVARPLVVLVLASAVFLVAFVCDTGALGRVFWAAIVGQFGLLARLAACAALLVPVFLVAAKLTRPAPSPPAKRRRNATPRGARNEEQSPRTRAGDGELVDPKPANQRSRRKKPDPGLSKSS